MDKSIAVILSTLLFKLASLGVGAMLCLLGFRLFKLGIWGQNSEMEAAFNDIKIVLRSAAPGVFFALFGACVIGLTVYKDLNLSHKETQTQGERMSQDQPTGPEDSPPPLP